MFGRPTPTKHTAALQARAAATIIISELLKVSTSRDVLDGRVDALPGDAPFDHAVGALRRAADAQDAVAALEDALGDRMEQLGDGSRTASDVRPAR
jgi:hypothetical protein